MSEGTVSSRKASIAAMLLVWWLWILLTGYSDGGHTNDSQGVPVPFPARTTQHTPTVTPTAASGDCQDTHCVRILPRTEPSGAGIAFEPSPTPTAAGGDCQDTHCVRINP